MGFRTLDWTDAQLEKMHKARLKGQQVKPHRYRSGTAALHDIHHFQKMAASIDALAARVGDMTTEQVEETAVTSEIGHMRGLEEITNVCDKLEVALI